MQLEDYFDFLNPDEIRIKGHRICIEDVIKYHLEGYTSQEILQKLPSINLEKIYATLTYYYQNKEQIDDYINRINQWQENEYQQWLNSEASPVIKRLRELKKQQKQLQIN